MTWTLIDAEPGNEASAPPTAELFELNVLWGSFGVHGEWFPGPNLQMSIDEQWRKNQITFARLAAKKKV